MDLTEELLRLIQNAEGDRALQHALLDTFAVGIRDAERERIATAVEALREHEDIDAAYIRERAWNRCIDRVLAIVRGRHVTPLTTQRPTN